MSRGLAKLIEFPRLEAVDVERVIGEYDQRVTRSLRNSTRRLKSDARKIAQNFSRFRTAAMASLPHQAVMNQAAIAGLLERTAFQVEQLVRELDPVYAEAMKVQATTSRLIAADFADLFVESPFPTILATSPAAINLAMDFSADLIGVRHGGLGAKMLQEINQVVRLAALGAGPGGFNAAAAIGKALHGPRFGTTWSHQAERIYRTEVLRIQSLAAQASINDLNKITPTRKRWIWSGISRRDHSAANNQTVAANGRFSIKARVGIVKMRFPRDPTAPPDASINCGCYVVPWPVEGAKRRTRRAPIKKKKVAKAKPTKAPKQSTGQLARTDVDTGFVNAKTLVDAQLQAETYSQRSVFSGAELVDKNGLRYTYNAAKATRHSARQWGGKVTSKKKQLEALNRANREFDRLARLYPKIAPKEFGKLENFAITKNAGGRAHATKPINKSTMQIPSENWDSYGTAGKTADDAWAQAQRSHSARLSRDRGTPIKEGLLDEREHALPQVVRHEYAHTLDGQLGIVSNPEWQALMKKYDDKFWWENVSEYSRHAAYPAKQQHWESWAELFRTTTGPHYVKGTLPADLEAFVEKIIGAAL